MCEVLVVDLLVSFGCMCWSMRAHIYICVCLLKMYVCYYFLLGLVVTRRHGLADRLRVLYGLRDLFNWSAAATVSERLGLRLRKFCSSNGNITINTSVSFSMRTSYSRLLLHGLPWIDESIPRDLSDIFYNSLESVLFLLDWVRSAYRIYVSKGRFEALQNEWISISQNWSYQLSTVSPIK